MAPSRNFRNILEAITKYPPSASDAQALIGVLERFVEPQLPFPSYSVTVNYDQTIEQLIRANKYDWFNDDVTSRHFPSNEKCVAELLVHLVNFNRDISSEDAIKELGQMNQPLRPATLKELFALSAQHPNLQRNDPIVALGSKWRASDGGLMVPYLSSYEGSRSLHLISLDGDWPAYWRFAAVRK